MLILLLYGQLISSRPPLSPEEAVAVLRSSHSPIDHTVSLNHPPVSKAQYDWEVATSGVYVLRSSASDGPFGAFPPYPEPINQPGWTTSFYIGPDYWHRHHRQLAFPPVVYPPIVRRTTKSR